MYRNKKGELKAGMVMLAEFAKKEQTVNEKNAPLKPECVASLKGFAKFMEENGIEDHTADKDYFYVCSNSDLERILTSNFV